MKKVIKIILLLMCLAGVVGIGISVANSFEKDDATQGHIHKYEDVVVEATCTADGYSVKECACGKSLGEKTVIKATGHSYGDWITDKAATCTESGSKHKECANCDKRIDEVIAATGHNYANTITAPTCTDKGYTTHTCQACGYKNVDSYVNEKGHSYTGTKTEPTCTAQGYTTHTCKDCENSYVDSYVSPTGHTYGDWYVTTAPTCTSTGVERRDCKNCSHYETREAAKAEHNFGDWYAVTTPTCSSSVERRDCKDCGYSETRDGELAAHTFGDWYVTTAPTCTSDGEERRDCKNCDYYEPRSVAATGHAYEGVVTAPTCTAQGYTTHTCKACEDSYVDSYVTATGHTYGDWIIDKAATCTEAGSKHKKCASCGDISSAAIEPTGHNYGDWIIDEKATCTEAGWKHKECNNCGSVLTTESIPIIDHDWDVEYLEYVAPTCTVEGYYLRPCNNCEATTKDMIAATGHNCSWESSNGYGWRNVCSICGDCVESWEVDLLKTSVYYTSVDGITGSGEIASVTSRTGYPEERKEVIGLQAAQYKRTNGVTGYFILAVESAENCTATLTQDNSTGCYTLTITNVTGNASVVIGQAEAYDLSLSFTSSYHLELGSSQNAYKACGSVSGDLPETISTTENSCITILSRAVQGGSATTRVYLELTVKSCENAAWCELVEDSDGYYFLYIRANGNGPVNVVITEK